MSNEIANVHEKPEWMLDDGKAGTEDMQRYVRPPRLILIQPTAKSDIKQYGEGNGIVMPGEQVVCNYDMKEKCAKEPMIFVPIFYYVEYTLDNPRELHSTKGRIRERTFDHNSEIAQRANNYKLRSAPCPDLPEKDMLYTVRLNYLWYLLKPNFHEPVMVTFKRSAQNEGMNFNSLIRARNAPMYGCQFAADVQYNENAKGQWYSWKVTNPPEEVGPWVTNRELYAEFKSLYEKMAEAFESRLIDVDDDDEHVVNKEEEEAEF